VPWPPADSDCRVYLEGSWPELLTSSRPSAPLVRRGSRLGGPAVPAGAGRCSPGLYGAQGPRLRAARHQLEPHDELGTHRDGSCARPLGPLEGRAELEFVVQT
jgi:hypothetical protein